eukprot:CAMPEP_0170602844 /NCGR_PEP_ID=MMETSP0224-20130122/18605_1 /TAXON_ID=285029 /ORGANISM="Togula jolla, Strain CCCM 725" /LENGTH=475 /DNA_ID=CAMNT_0010927705 /DNA_START=56 /DNA_END=1483 /DNA_ORIENTATION=+
MTSLASGTAFATAGFAPVAKTSVSASPLPAARVQSLRGAESSTREAGAGQGAALGALAVGITCAGLHRANRRRRVKAKGCVVSAKGGDVSASFTGVCEQTGVTLNRYMIEMTKRGIVDKDIESIFNSIREATKVIAKLVNRAPLSQAELLGLEGEVNVQGEDQKKLDVITNDVLKKALQYSGKLGTLASEEEDAPVVGSRTADGKVISRGSDAILAETGNYVCVFDPLDGSSNVDAGIAVGTIFGIFKEADVEECKIPLSDNLSEDEVACLASTLQPGKALVAAGYVLYSCSTELVFTVGRGCVGFTLDPSIGEYVLTRPRMRIPERGNLYSLNEANKAEWDEPMKEYIKNIQSGRGETGKKYSLRYIGSMVGDVHRTLLYGGLFAYPADKKNPNGKLRLLYEAAPMSFILEQAGGMSSTGLSRVMDIPPTGVHQRVPIILGSTDDVAECCKYYQKSDDKSLKKRENDRMDAVVS